MYIIPALTLVHSIHKMPIKTPSLINTSLALRFRPLSRPQHLFRSPVRTASTRAPETDKSRILERPAKFNPPSHGSRRVRPRSYPGPRITDAEREAMKAKRYPNMMPPEGSFLWRFLHDRRIHMWITLVRFANSCPSLYIRVVEVPLHNSF